MLMKEGREDVLSQEKKKWLWGCQVLGSTCWESRLVKLDWIVKTQHLSQQTQTLFYQRLVGAFRDRQPHQTLIFYRYQISWIVKHPLKFFEYSDSKVHSRSFPDGCLFSLSAVHEITLLPLNNGILLCGKLTSSSRSNKGTMRWSKGTCQETYPVAVSCGAESDVW